MKSPPRLLLLIHISLCLQVAAIDIDINANNATELKPLSARNMTDWIEYRNNFTDKIFPNSSYEESRARIFFDNVADIDAHNELYHNGSESYERGINQFTYMTDEEYAAMFPPMVVPKEFEEMKEDQIWMGEIMTDDFNETTSTNSSMTRHKRQFKMDAKTAKELEKQAPQALKGMALKAPPATLDLRKTGEVGPVRNQQSCGSCYTYSAMSSVESAYYRVYKKSIDLSEQQALECWPSTPGRGCQGGFPAAVMQGIQKSGITLEKTHPYQNREGPCRQYPAATKVHQVHKVPPDVNSMKAALNNYGPLAIALDAGPRGVGSYKSGIVYAPASQPNHAVSIVGYGKEGAREFWIIRNSWGTTWGEKGYLRMDIKSPVNQMFPYGVTIKKQ